MTARSVSSRVPPVVLADNLLSSVSRLVGAMQDYISSNLRNSANMAPSSMWQDVKRSGKANVLCNQTVENARIVAATVHKGQQRADGTSMIMHLEETALVVAMLGLDAAPVAAALLHECLNDEDMDEYLLSKFVTNEVVSLVSGVAKASRLTDLYGAEAGLHDEVRAVHHCVNCHL
jgi:(p)ppGpp synthase/HD superfamily hydrolase